MDNITNILQELKNILVTEPLFLDKVYFSNKELDTFPQLQVSLINTSIEPYEIGTVQYTCNLQITLKNKFKNDDDALFSNLSTLKKLTSLLDGNRTLSSLTSFFGISNIRYEDADVGKMRITIIDCDFTFEEPISE